MNHANTDLTEEDAADLQFPKESITEYDSFNTSGDEDDVPLNVCANCAGELQDKFILCVPCDVQLCTMCFANGAEFMQHRNDHDYKVLHSNFVLFENTDWTAKEEMTLLGSLLKHSNWDAVAKDLPNRGLKEIKEHYDQYYLGKKGSALMPDVRIMRNFTEPTVPYRFKLNNIQEPFRNFENTPAGYNAARSEFDHDFEKSAEGILSGLATLDAKNPNFSLLNELQVAIANIYRSKLIERQRRKRIIREHGLISQQKLIAWLHRYDITLTQSVVGKLTRFMQFCSARKFEYIMEGLHRTGELKIQIARLCEYRKKGIKTLEEANLFIKLKKSHDDGVRELKRFQQIAELNVKLKNAPILMPMGSAKRRSVTPLDIHGLQGYEKLLEKERDLCRNIRLAPMNYLDLKTILIAENNKLGSLRLHTARRLLKIDVNKTRKLYDFLMEEGYITKPSD